MLPLEFRDEVSRDREETRVTGISSSEERMIVAWAILTWYRTVTGWEQTIRRLDRRNRHSKYRAVHSIASYHHRLLRQMTVHQSIKNQVYIKCIQTDKDKMNRKCAIKWEISIYTITTKLSYRDNRAMRPIQAMVPWKFRESLCTPATTFPKSLMGFCSDRSYECTYKIWSRSFTRSWDNSNWSFGWGLRTPNLGEEEAVWGRGWYRSKERWWIPIGAS